MNTYCPLIKFTFTKKLTDRDSPKRTTYSSPTLKRFVCLCKNLSTCLAVWLSGCLYDDDVRMMHDASNFWDKLDLDGMGPTDLPSELLAINWYCNSVVDRNTQARHSTTPELPINNTTRMPCKMDIAAQTCQFRIDLVPYLANGAPSQVIHDCVRERRFPH